MRYDLYMRRADEGVVYYMMLVKIWNKRPVFAGLAVSALL
jgi:hypothetical protein